EDLRRNLMAQVGSHLSAVVTSMEVHGGTVVGRVELRTDGSRAVGIDRFVHTFVAQVPDERIAVWVSVADAADEQTAQLRAVQQPQAKQAPVPDREPGPYTFGATRRTFVRASSTTGEPRYLDTVI